VTWFAPALSWIRDLGTYVDNELQASAVASCFTVAIKSHTPVGNLFDPDGGTGTDAAGNRQRYVEPGMIMELAPGEDVVGLNPGRPNAGAEPWIQLILRGIAVGTGLSYEVVARDYSQTSYSSSRTSQLEDRRRFRCWQQYLIRHLCQPVWDAFCDAAAISALRGFATSAELLDDRRRYAPVEWQTPEWEWVDPQSEQTASEMALNSFTDTYQNVLGSRGRSFRSVFYQRAKEERMRKKLGLITPEERQQQISAAQTAAMAPAESPTAQSSPTQPQEQRQTGSGEMMGLSTLQFNRNRKAIAKTLEDLANKTISQTQARVFLSSIGMSAENVEALINDAIDGSVDTKLPEASDAV
jgi:capsid protein